MSVTPDEIILWESGWFKLNATILFTWAIMLLMVVGSWLVTRRLSSGTDISRGQNLLEIVVQFMRNQIEEVSRQDPDPFLPFVGTLFLFIAVSNVLTIIPYYEAPTGSLSTTAALAIMVFIAVPFFGIRKKGVMGYLKQYAKPSILMLPFNVIGELSRTLALAVRLFGNIMSGRMIIAILLIITPLIFPIIMQAMGLLIGLIQAYIFGILAIVYIAAATMAQDKVKEGKGGEAKGET